MWDPLYQSAFNQYSIIDFTKKIVLETDVSGSGLGAVLSQEQDNGLTGLIAFANRML